MQSDGIPQTFDWAQGDHGFYAHQVQEFTGGWGAQSCRMATIDLLDAFLDNLENRGMVCTLVVSPENSGHGG